MNITLKSLSRDTFNHLCANEELRGQVFDAIVNGEGLADLQFRNICLVITGIVARNGGKILAIKAVRAAALAFDSTGNHALYNLKAAKDFVEAVLPPQSPHY